MYCKITGRYGCSFADKDVGLCGTSNGKCIYEDAEGYRKIEDDDDLLDELESE